MSQQHEPDKNILKRIQPDYINPSVRFIIQRLEDQQTIDISELYDEELTLWELIRGSPSSLPEERLAIADDCISISRFTFCREHIQWFGHRKHSDFARLDVSVHGRWYKVYMVPNTDKDEFFRKLRSRVPQKLQQSRYINRPEVRTSKGSFAYITTRNLHGIFENHEDVMLHVTPLWMVVLHDDKVFQQHFIDDIKDIRCSQHPTDKNREMQLLTFEVNDTAYAYTLRDRNFATRLSDAAREGVDSNAVRKKKK